MKRMRNARFFGIIIGMMMLTLSFSACSSTAKKAKKEVVNVADKAKEEVVNAANTLITDAKDELDKVEAEAGKLGADSTTDTHKIITNVKDEFAKIEEALKDGTQTGIDSAKNEISKLGDEISKLKEEAGKLEKDSSAEIHKVISNLENKFKEIEDIIKTKI